MASEPVTLLTFTELQAMLEAHPDEIRRHELIDGVLYVTAYPFNPHQWMVGEIQGLLWTYQQEHGGMTLPGGGVYYDEYNYVEPDLLYTRAEHLDRVTARYTEAAPDLVVEVSSKSTRRRDLTIKRGLYERTGVVEYWFVDLRDKLVLVHRRDPGFDQPLRLGPGDTLTSPVLPGFALPVANLQPPF